MKDGFYPALGTPLNDWGQVIPSSLSKHVEDMVQAKASALLVMGSMGQQANIKNSEYVKIARTAVEAVKGDCPVFVGVMDNSIHRVLERIDSLKELKLDGVVATTPFYYPMDQREVKRFYEGIAKASSFPIYMYDLPGVTKTKIEVSTAAHLMLIDNIVGIKTGDLPTARTLHRLQQSIQANFDVLFSGLDVFDVAYSYGLRKQLDGMFACTTALNMKLYSSLASGNQAEASECLDDILSLRDMFVSVGVFGAFTHAMNLLGFEGNFAPDYGSPLNEQDKDKVEQCMRQLKLLKQ